MHAWYKMVGMVGTRHTDLALATGRWRYVEYRMAMTRQSMAGRQPYGEHMVDLPPALVEDGGIRLLVPIKVW